MYLFNVVFTDMELAGNGVLAIYKFVFLYASFGTELIKTACAFIYIKLIQVC